MRWHAAPVRALALATAAALVVALAVLPHIRSSIPTAAPVGLGSAATAAEAAPADAVDLDADDAWALVRTLAADLDDDEMRDEGVSAGEDAVEHLTSQLTDAERTELARLLREQLSLGVHAESAS